VEGMISIGMLSWRVLQAAKRARNEEEKGADRQEPISASHQGSDNVARATKCHREDDIGRRRGGET